MGRRVGILVRRRQGLPIVHLSPELSQKPESDVFFCRLVGRWVTMMQALGVSWERVRARRSGRVEKVSECSRFELRWSTSRSRGRVLGSTRGAPHRTAPLTVDRLGRVGVSCDGYGSRVVGVAVCCLLLLLLLLLP